MLLPWVGGPGQPKLTEEAEKCLDPKSMSYRYGSPPAS